jgi:arsenate reductase-like glutaredoxin family protein
MVTPNTHFPEYQEHIAGKDLSEDQLLDVLARVPNLLKKPVLVDGTRILQGTKEPEKLAAFVALRKEA